MLVEPAPLIGRGLRAIEEYHSASKSTPSGKLLKALAALDNAVLRPAASAPGRLDLASDWSDYRRAAAKSVWNDIVATERLFVAERVRDPRARDRERAPTRVGFRA